MIQLRLERFSMRIVDLFAGCGGLSKGFQNAGFQIVAAFEFWNKAAECYALNFSHPVFTTDLSNIEEAVGKSKIYNRTSSSEDLRARIFLMRESASKGVARD